MEVMSSAILLCNACVLLTDVWVQNSFQVHNIVYVRNNVQMRNVAEDGNV